MTTKRCSNCQLVKSRIDFSKRVRSHDGLLSRCKSCDAKRTANLLEQGLKILQSLAKAQGSCAHCQRPYFNEDWHFFEFDHIDPTLKRSTMETNSRWVVSHFVEFTQRVKPNLQLLCIKCHKNKTSQEQKRGGATYQKKYGQSQPAQVLDFGWDLFNPIPTPEADDYTSWSWSLIQREGDWIVQRDIDGRIIHTVLTKH